MEAVTALMTGVIVATVAREPCAGVAIAARAGRTAIATRSVVLTACTTVLPPLLTVPLLLRETFKVNNNYCHEINESLFGVKCFDRGCLDDTKCHRQR